MRKRKDSFFGLHYDFHAGRNSIGLGDCNVEVIDKMLSEVKPDFVQCDTKGHAGISSYPTKVGNPAPEMKGDLLKTWRKLTEKHDIALYAHHSGVWDTEAIAKNPDWAVIRENGEKSENITSVFGPYSDELLIPQLIEMAKDYELNGAWVDGECWATDEDYSHNAVEKYKVDKIIYAIAASDSETKKEISQIKHEADTEIRDRRRSVRQCAGSP